MGALASSWEAKGVLLVSGLGKPVLSLSRLADGAVQLLRLRMIAPAMIGVKYFLMRFILLKNFYWMNLY